MDLFQVFNIQDFVRVGEESMGTSARHWYRVADNIADLQSKQRWLLKVPARFPGEIWSEKTAEAIGTRMGLPIARVELARQSSDEPLPSGTICLSFVDRSQGMRFEPGNELMEQQARAALDRYLRDDEGQVGLDAVYDFLRSERTRPPLQITPEHALAGESADFFFTGYLVLDALIGNVDRHHENWGAVLSADGRLHLAPTFDHGACLGRELQPAKRNNYLTYRQVDTYASNRKSAAKIAPPGQTDRITPFKVLKFLPDIGQRHALCYWLQQALRVEEVELAQIFARFPPGVLPDDARQFALGMTAFTRRELDKLYQEIR